MAYPWGMFAFLKTLFSPRPNLPDQGPADDDEQKFEQELDSDARAQQPADPGAGP